MEFLSNKEEAYKTFP